MNELEDFYVGEIRMFTGNFAPVDWAFCDGQLLPIQGNEMLYSVLDVHYGGDGVNTFGLPDMRGRIPVHQGRGINLTNRTLGEKFGVERATLSVDQIPSHTHVLLASSTSATSKTPEHTVLATTNENFYDDGTQTPKITQLDAGAVDNTGSNQMHSNIQPYLCLNFIISLKGIYPSRN